MPRTRYIIDALRVVAVWLLVMSVFFGPAGLGGSSAFAATAATCGAACPCDETADEAPAGDHQEHAEADPCDDGDADVEQADPCQDECPDGCPNCGCCRVIAMAVLALPVTSGTTSCASARVLAAADRPTPGADIGVFRPPRSPLLNHSHTSV